MISSRLPGFYRLTMAERLRRLAAELELAQEQLAPLGECATLPLDRADAMVENALGVLGMPLGLGANFVINGEQLLVPMAVEEPSVIAAASVGAKLARAGGGFTADADEARMIGQVQITDLANPAEARDALLHHRAEILAAANALRPSMQARGGGAKDLQVRLLRVDGETQAVVHLVVDARDAMGASLVNTMCEGIAQLVGRIAGGRVGLRILSNLADLRLARASCSIPVSALGAAGYSGPQVAESIAAASRLAEADPYRACTNNKGVMNGVDAVVLATGNDWRAVEAGAHAYCVRDGQYQPLTRWRVEGEALRGALELPIQVGTVGRAVSANPLVPVLLHIMGNPNARKLSAIMAAVGLASNLAALRALGTVGIQQSYLALHRRVAGESAVDEVGRRG
jgi:hydroxymethylglutaryl-CoA reductase